MCEREEDIIQYVLDSMCVRQREREDTIYSLCLRVLVCRSILTMSKNLFMVIPSATFELMQI